MLPIYLILMKVILYSILNNFMHETKFYGVEFSTGSCEYSESSDFGVF
jgi:hypothetical protein